jgi:uncharacterized protein (TIGR03118 family)
MTMRLALWRAALAGLALAAVWPATGRADFQQTNLVSDGFVAAEHTDPNLKNPWGVSFGGKGPFWVSDQGTGVATLYNGNGVPQPGPPHQPLVVSIPPGGGNGNPTGQVFNPGIAAGDFALHTGGPAVFLFASLNGTISGWNGGNSAQLAVTQAGAVFTGLAVNKGAGGDFLYAADNAGGKIDVYNSHFALTTLTGNFTDPNLPKGFVPFNIQKVGDHLIVTYQNPTAGGGVVDSFNTNGTFDHRIFANAAGGPLADPWGVALAPKGFGKFGGDLLVGNNAAFDGRIGAYDPTTMTFKGFLSDALGNPIVNTGLWALNFGNGGPGADPNTLFIAAGLNGEQDGVFAAIKAVPEPASLALLGLGAAFAARWRRRHPRSE